MNPDLGAAPGIVALVLVSVATLAIGTYGLRFSRTTSDFMVASRTVRPRMNASAISGEYLSAASFLGVAGLLLTFGADMLWYPVGWTAGYLVLLTLVAAPLRRSGAYTLPDFAEARLDSQAVRRACSLLVVAIGLVLDWRTPGGSDYTPEAFRWAMSTQYVLWTLGLVQVYRYRLRARRTFDRAALEAGSTP